MLASMAQRRISLSVPLPEGEPPDRVLLLKMGVNSSTHGDFVLDADALADVLADWETHTKGLDHPGMIDLENLSLDPDAPNFDPDSRAWFELAAPDGSGSSSSSSSDPALALLPLLELLGG
jgi:hypothetical protein